MRHGQGHKPDQSVQGVDGQCQDKEGIAQGFQAEEEFSDHLNNMDSTSGSEGTPVWPGVRVNLFCFRLTVENS